MLPLDGIIGCHGGERRQPRDTAGGACGGYPRVARNEVECKNVQAPACTREIVKRSRGGREGTWLDFDEIAKHVHSTPQCSHEVLKGLEKSGHVSVKHARCNRKVHAVE